MANHEDELIKPLPMKFTLDGFLIYFAPLFFFAWFGAFWKVASVITISFGVWKSEGLLRRVFGIVFLLSVLIGGARAKIQGDDWPGSTEFFVWWIVSALYRIYLDGVKAEKQPINQPRGWD